MINITCNLHKSNIVSDLVLVDLLSNGIKSDNEIRDSNLTGGIIIKRDSAKKTLNLTVLLIIKSKAKIE